MNGENESEYKVLVKKKPGRKRDTCVDVKIIQGGSNMTGTNCDLFTHK
jgi:hypothetical protein